MRLVPLTVWFLTAPLAAAAQDSAPVQQVPDANDVRVGADKIGGLLPRVGVGATNVSMEKTPLLKAKGVGHAPADQPDVQKEGGLLDIVGARDARVSLEQTPLLKAAGVHNQDPPIIIDGGPPLRPIRPKRDDRGLMGPPIQVDPLSAQQSPLLKAAGAHGQPPIIIDGGPPIRPIGATRSDNGVVGPPILVSPPFLAKSDLLVAAGVDDTEPDIIIDEFGPNISMPLLNVALINLAFQLEGGPLAASDLDPVLHQIYAYPDDRASVLRAKRAMLIAVADFAALPWQEPADARVLHERITDARIALALEDLAGASAAGEVIVDRLPLIRGLLVERADLSAAGDARENVERLLELLDDIEGRPDALAALLARLRLAIARAQLESGFATLGNRMASFGHVLPIDRVHLAKALASRAQWAQAIR